MRDNPVPDLLADRFEILGVNAAGDIGTLYRAVDGAGVSGVLKVMRLSRSASDAGKQRLQRDLERQVGLPASERASYPRSAGVEGGVAWLFREWVAGRSLKSRLFRDGKLGAAEAMTVTARVAFALDELHRIGLVHGALRPGHVILRAERTEGPEVVLIDAGIAGDTQRGSAFEDLGDLLYMSPEQMRGKPVSFRSDLYALGCLFYDALMGEPPFDGDTAEEVMAAHQHVTPTIPRELLPSSVADLLERLLAKNASDRPVSTREVITTLKPYASEIEPERKSSRPPAPRPASRPATRSSAPPAPAVSLASVSSRGNAAPSPAVSLASVSTRSSAPPPMAVSAPSTRSSAPPAAAPSSRVKSIPPAAAVPVDEIAAASSFAEPPRRRSDPSSLRIALAEIADVAERTGSFAIQRVRRWPWLSLGVLIGCLGTAATAYGMAVSGKFHLITGAMETYLSVPRDMLNDPELVAMAVPAPVAEPEPLDEPEPEPVIDAVSGGATVPGATAATGGEAPPSADPTAAPGTTAPGADPTTPTPVAPTTATPAAATTGATVATPATPAAPTAAPTVPATQPVAEPAAPEPSRQTRRAERRRRARAARMRASVASPTTSSSSVIDGLAL